MAEYNNLEAIEQRIGELVEDLGKTAFGTEEYDARAKELETLSKVRESFVRTELQRIDNDAKNDIAEAELVVRQQDVKNGKIRNALTFVTSLLYMGTSTYQGMKSYKMNETLISFKPMERSAERLRDKIVLK